SLGSRFCRPSLLRPRRSRSVVTALPPVRRQAATSDGSAVHAAAVAAVGAGRLVATSAPTRPSGRSGESGESAVVGAGAVVADAAAGGAARAGRAEGGRARGSRGEGPHRVTRSSGVAHGQGRARAAAASRAQAAGARARCRYGRRWRVLLVEGEAGAHRRDVRSAALPASFYARPTPQVARGLLGHVLL